MNCRHCHKPLHHVFLDLKDAPPSNSYLTKEQLDQPEARYPLRLFVCDQCWLVQTEDFARAEDLFAMDYAYFSSTSTTWLDHAERYCAMIIRRLDLNRDSFVIEVASNDGYLLRNFVRDGIPCLGPTELTAKSFAGNGRKIVGSPPRRRSCSMKRMSASRVTTTCTTTPTNRRR